MKRLNIMDEDIFMDCYPGDYIIENKSSLKEISKKYPEIISITESLLNSKIEYVKFLMQEMFYHMILFRYDEDRQYPHSFRTFWRYQTQLSLICKDSAILNYLREGKVSKYYESISSYCYTETVCRIDTEYNEIDGMGIKIPLNIESDYDKRVYNIDYIIDMKNIEEYLYENSRSELREYFHDLLKLDK